MKLRLGFKGGAELLFDNRKEVDVDPPTNVTTVGTLLPWIRDNLCRERPELFLSGETVRPGILVLINEADWELEGQLEYVLQPGDEILFISTLHGG